MLGTRDNYFIVGSEQSKIVESESYLVCMCVMRTNFCLRVLNCIKNRPSLLIKA